MLEDAIFTGPWKITKEPFYDPKHPAVKEWNPPDTYVFIIPIELIDNEFVCSLQDIFDKLLFLTNRKRKGRGGGYSDHFQFSIISIREEDYDTILENANNKKLL